MAAMALVVLIWCGTWVIQIAAWLLVVAVRLAGAAAIAACVLVALPFAIAERVLKARQQPGAPARTALTDSSHSSRSAPMST